ncbi:MAG: TonB-dependent receptor [Gammaproteobacteria bacterium]|uniref:TonB-dependent receptor n=1 Tax=Pseudomaricurvus alcaniphilus TaxID=1166482 RepID=UPI00140992D6|nr:TonB-dependent receptor [Pseudomaricurvus alcaniphilus]MBR9910085.1 TonB-dependent receptor [Gammaproteobacteria bacterium]NHN36601.1 TonB-dependent receptor [Pseudomaricurvus alcaniphilus]
MNLSAKSKLAAALTTQFLLLSGSVSAAVLEEVVVTAQKREQNMQDVSVSVTAFSGNALRELSLTSSTEIAAQTPGLNIGTPVGEGNNPSISLRGVGLNDFNDNNEGPIAVYRDEVYQSAMPGLTFQLFDLERVEVLRGPQGTLYGRNATGGLVHFISKKPSDEFEGYVDLTLAENNQVKLEAAVGGALGEKVQGRLSVASNQHDGYVKNRIGPDANEADSYAYRAQLNVDINDNLSALLNVHGGESDTNAPQYQHEATDDGTGAAGVADFYGYRDSDGDPFAGDYDREGVLNIESSGASLTLNWSSGDLQFVSITAVENVEKLHQEDTDVGPFDGVTPDFASENDQVSQEFRLSGSNARSNWVLGAYYFDNEVDGALDIDVNFPGPLVDAITGAPDGTFGTDFVTFFNYDVDYVQTTESTGIFGQYEYILSDLVKLSMGLRYTTEERTMDYQNRTDGDPDAVLNSCLLPAGDPCDLGLGASFPGTVTFLDFTDANPAVGNLNEIDVDNISGKLGIDITPADNILVFANVARGFKSGGFNGGFLDFTDGVMESDVAFDEEQLTSYELGVKTNTSDGKLRFNATVFYYDYKDYQALTFAGLSQFINNSDATVQGLDLELVWMPTENWDINLGASVLDTEVDEVQVRGADPVRGSEMVLAPEFSLNGLVRYQATDALSLQLDFNHQGDHYFDITNSDRSKEDAYTVFNARVGYQVNENLKVALFAKNLTDEEYRVYTFDFTGPAGLNQQFYAPPRWVGANLNYSF